MAQLRLQRRATTEPHVTPDTSHRGNLVMESPAAAKIAQMTALAQGSAHANQMNLLATLSQLHTKNAGRSNTAPVQRARNQSGLPDELKTGIESLSGMSMDSVKVHYNSAKPAQMNAHAYAQGSQIHVAPGQERHLPHEAWHVVQQAQGRVKPTAKMHGNIAINDNKSLEREADVMGTKALSVQRKATAEHSLGTTATHITKPLAQFKKGKKHYWVRPDGGKWTYVGEFGDHSSANEWWKANKSNYPKGEFSQGKTANKFK